MKRPAPPSWPQRPEHWNTHVRVDDVGQTVARAEHAGGKLLAGPFGGGADGGFAVVADATGVPFCLRQAGEGGGAELADEPDSWAMSSLHTTDVERAQAFFGAMFDWELESVPGAAFELGGAILMAPMDTPGFRNAVIGDPQGGFIAVSSGAG